MTWGAIGSTAVSVVGGKLLSGKKSSGGGGGGSVGGGTSQPIPNFRAGGLGLMYSEDGTPYIMPTRHIKHKGKIGFQQSITLFSLIKIKGLD
jgi:hypothetical protein